MEYKILNPKDKYCSGCGNKTEPKPDSFFGFDEETGKQCAYLRCINRSCKKYICIDVKHDLKTEWFLFFPSGKQCRNCRYYESGSDLVAA